jgi:hypothetical protein
VQLVLALAVLAGAFLRPPGVMLDRDGDSINYVICTGGDTRTITVLLSDGGPIPVETDDAGCDFFAHQIATAPIVTAVSLPVVNQRYARLEVVAETIFVASATRRAHAPRGPPVLL